MLTHFHRFQPDPAARLHVHEAADVIEHMPRRGLAADGRQHPQRDQTGGIEALKLGDCRIVRGGQGGVVEHVVQPGANRLEAAEIEAPVALVQRLAGENEMKRQRVAVQQAAMRMAGAPLPEAAGQSLAVAVGLGGPEDGRLARLGLALVFFLCWLFAKSIPYFPPAK